MATPVRLKLLQPRPIYFRYCDAQSVETERVVTPSALEGTLTSYEVNGKRMEGNTDIGVLLGYCHTRKAPRRFLLKWMEDIADAETGELLDGDKFQHAIATMRPELAIEDWAEIVAEDSNMDGLSEDPAVQAVLRNARELVALNAATKATKVALADLKAAATRSSVSAATAGVDAPGGSIPDSRVPLAIVIAVLLLVGALILHAAS